MNKHEAASVAIATAEGEAVQPLPALGLSPEDIVQNLITHQALIFANTAPDSVTKGPQYQLRYTEYREVLQTRSLRTLANAPALRAMKARRP